MEAWSVVSFLLECRTAAKNCPDILIRKLLRDTTDMLQHALKSLAEKPTKENMQRAVALWTRTHVILDKATPVPDPSPRAGAGEIEQERMAA